MNVYVYQSAFLCEDCGPEVRANLTPSYQRGDECRHGNAWCTDSDCWPDGLYPDGGGEADSPQHCDRCHRFLRNPLTSDGWAYVTNLILRGDCNVPEWIDYYDVPTGGPYYDRFDIVEAHWLLACEQGDYARVARIRDRLHFTPRPSLRQPIDLSENGRAIFQALATGC